MQHAERKCCIKIGFQMTFEKLFLKISKLAFSVTNSGEDLVVLQCRALVGYEEAKPLEICTF